jgi:hypothetical protein
METLPKYRSGLVDIKWSKFGAKPYVQPFKLIASSSNGAPSFSQLTQLKK